MHRRKVAVVGAGLAGLVAARKLQESGARVEVFDKGRFAGGRLASRTRDGDQFDYGAQYFTVRDPRFLAFIEPLIKMGVVAPWRGRLLEIDSSGVREHVSEHERYVGVPVMRSLADHLAGQFSPLFNSCRVGRVEKNSGGYLELVLDNERRVGPYDFVVLSMPPHQCIDLLASVNSGLKHDVAGVHMDPCWTLMVSFAKDPRLLADGARRTMDGAFVREHPCSWIAFDSGKPGRPLGERWVVQAGAQWSQERIDSDPIDVEVELLAAFFTCLGIGPEVKITPRFRRMHLWRYANASSATNSGGMAAIDVPVDLTNRIAVCGDWCVQNRAEGAYLSGLASAEKIISQLSA